LIERIVQQLSRKEDAKIVETSSKTGFNVREAFEILAEDILLRYKILSIPSRSIFVKPLIDSSNPTARRQKRHCTQRSLRS